MSALPVQLHAAFAAAPPELRATLMGDLLQPSGHDHPARQANPMPWPGVLHEVFSADIQGQVGRFAAHHPFPAAVLVGWAARQLDHGRRRLTVWVGRRIWPYPPVLDRAGLLGGSLFIDATDNNQRLWSAELALRSPAVATVIADGSGFGMSATRRLQLIARESDALMLLARPSHDQHHLSAAGARWRVAPVPARGEDIDAPQWSVQLLRCKGVRPATASHDPSQPAWTFRWDAQSASTPLIENDLAASLPGRPPAHLADRPPAAPPHAPRRTG